MTTAAHRGVRVAERPNIDVAAARRRRRGRALNVAAFAILLALAALWILPLAWALDTALKPNAETASTTATWAIKNPTFDAFRRVLSGDMLHWYVNSAVTSAIITVLTVAFGSMAAYAFSQLRFPGRTVLFWVLMAGLTVPLDVLIIPLFTQLSSWHMINTYWAIILPQVATPVAVFIMKQFFDGIPPALSRAARADGASHWRIFRSIYLPLARPAVGAVAIFTFVSAWNNFLWPFTAITSTNMMTIPVGIATVTNAYGIHYADLMASALLGGLPLLVLFVVFQRRVVQGIANTGLRG